MINIKSLSYNFPKLKTAVLNGAETIENGNYYGKISDKSLMYSGASPSFDFKSMPLYDSNGSKVSTLNVTHAYPQQGVLDEKTGYYYTYIGFNGTSDNAYINIAGISIPYNRTFGRLIKWHTTISGNFEYVGQVIVLGLSHQNLSIYDDKLFVTGTNEYNIISNNSLDTYKDSRCFLIPLSEFNFANPVSDANVLAVPAISEHFGSSYKGKTISTNYMFDKSPDYDDNGDPVYVNPGQGPQWLYGIADSNHIFTSNGNNIYVYNVDMENKKFLSANKELSNNINLGNTTVVYSTDKIRIKDSTVNDDTAVSNSDLNKYYTIKGRHVQSMMVRNNHLYVTMGAVNYAHSIENFMGVKIIDLKTGILIGEIDVEDLIEKHGSPIPSTYKLEVATDLENNKFRYLNNGFNVLIQELEDIYVSSDESFIIIGHVVSRPKYFKLDLKWDE